MSTYSLTSQSYSSFWMFWGLGMIYMYHCTIIYTNILSYIDQPVETHRGQPVSRRLRNARSATAARHEVGTLPRW